MVTIEEIQAAYYMVAATGVLVAAAYYVLNMRAAERNKKIQLSTSITERLSTKDWNRDFLQLYNHNWGDIDDFMKKYDSTVNPDSHALRWEVWATYDNLGYLLREGLVDKEMVFNSMGTWSILIFGRFKPVIDHYRRVELGPRWMENFEYLAREMWEMGKAHGSVSSGLSGDLMCDGFRNVFEPGGSQ
jgi:hypothetical protein